MNAWDDPRIQAGMKRLLAMRRARLERGERPIGWKLGFGAPAAMQRLGISAPLVGFLTDATRVASGDAVSIAGWTKPMAEPETAIHMGADLAPGSDRERVKAAIAGLGPAIELADLDAPLDQIEPILNGNIFHRAVILGPVDRKREAAMLQGLEGIVYRNGSELARTRELQANTGEFISLVAHVANVLAAFGEQLRAGDVIITGSAVPPVFPAPSDQSFGFELSPIGSVEVRFSV